VDKLEVTLYHIIYALVSCVSSFWDYWFWISDDWLTTLNNTKVKSLQSIITGTISFYIHYPRININKSAHLSFSNFKIWH